MEPSVARQWVDYHSFYIRGRAAFSSLSTKFVFRSEEIFGLRWQSRPQFGSNLSSWVLLIPRLKRFCVSLWTRKVPMWREKKPFSPDVYRRKTLYTSFFMELLSDFIIHCGWNRRNEMSSRLQTPPTSWHECRINPDMPKLLTWPLISVAFSCKFMLLHLLYIQVTGSDIIIFSLVAALNIHFFIFILYTCNEIQLPTPALMLVIQKTHHTIWLWQTHNLITNTHLSILTIMCISAWRCLLKTL